MDNQLLKLTSASGLFKQALKETKAKSKEIYSIIFVSSIFSAIFNLLIPLLSILGVNFGFTPLIVGMAVGIIMLAALVIISFWSQVALLEAILNDRDFASAFVAAKGKILLFFGTSVLAGLIIVGGFILLVIPGIIFSVWFGFVTFIVVAEGLGGMKAIKQSKSYVTGRWWSVAWRLLLMGLLSGLALIILYIIMVLLFGPRIASISNTIILLLLLPLQQVYLGLLYKNLKETMAPSPVNQIPETI